MIHLQENINFKGCTLLFPSVSVGNVGQLAMDLLINKLKPRKIGLIWHSSVIPLVGGDPFNFNSKALTTSSEIFHLEKEKLIFFQIRSPILQEPGHSISNTVGTACDDLLAPKPGSELGLVHQKTLQTWLLSMIQETSQDFVDKLISWMKEKEIDKIVILTGIFDYTRNDSELIGPVIKFIVSSNLAENCNIFAQSENEETSLQLEPGSVVVCDTAKHPSLTPLHGGGISKKLFNACIMEGLAAALVMKYCSEGDNIPDAVLLCSHVNRWLKLVESDLNWEHPPSWINMFGNPPQPGLY